MKIGITIIALCLMSLLASCVSGPTRMMTPAGPDKDYVEVGNHEGFAMSYMLLWCIPIRHSGRFNRAYDQAVYSHGGDAIKDIRVREGWFFTPVGNGYITKISGAVIKEKE